MDREIKFRAYCPKYGEWLYGATFAPIDKTVFYTENDEVFVNPDTIGQYVGRKDCNGKEIYEGDIVEIKIGYCGSPRYHESTRKMAVTYNSDLCYWNICNADIYSIEVIGNVFDNPDLLDN